MAAKWMLVSDHNGVFVKRSWVRMFAIIFELWNEWERKKKPVQMAKKRNILLDSLLLQWDMLYLFEPSAHTNTTLSTQKWDGGQMQTFQPSIYFHAWLVWYKIVKQLQWSAAVTFIFNHSVITAILEMAFPHSIQVEPFELGQFECAVWKPQYL